MGAGTTRCLEGTGVAFAPVYPSSVDLEGELPKGVQGGSARLAPLCLPNDNPSYGKNAVVRHFWAQLSDVWAFGMLWASAGAPNLQDKKSSNFDVGLLAFTVDAPRV
ncbi:unnamed protein product [Prunus armeniaca]